MGNMNREEAIRILASSCIPGSKQTEALETLIPELAENEDERIRKEIVSIVQSYRDSCISEGTHRFDDCLAWLEKQKDLDKMIVISPEVWDNAITDAYENGKRDSEKQKEQKPVESISQLTVQGKGVYKICPRCKERMVRDDSMVYTSMPPQYRYECPKCGESECDTVMYDNPKMEEQKPAEKHDLVAQLKEHLDNTPKEQLEAEWKELEHWNNIGPTVEEYFGSIKPAEWSKEDEKTIDDAYCWLCEYAGSLLQKNYGKSSMLYGIANKLKSLRSSWKPSEHQMNILKAVKDYVGKGSGYWGEGLGSLIEDLEKLM